MENLAVQLENISTNGVNKFEVLRFLPRIHAHWILNDTIWASHGFDIIVSYDNGQGWKKLATVPAKPLNRLLVKFECFRRLMRLGVKAYVQLSNREFIIFQGAEIFWWHQEQPELQRIGRVRQGSGPLPSGCCVDDEGNVYYGEYWRNPEREEARVYSWKSGAETWQQFYTFPAGAIRHIHALQFDPVSHKVWVATGDHDRESQIGYFDQSDSTPRLIVVDSGHQMARAVSLMFTRDYVYWGTDAGRGTGVKANHIYRWSRYNEQVAQVGEVGGPVYYSMVDQEARLFVSTVVEGSDSEPDRFARLWMSENGTEWNEITRWRKDNYPFLFGYGVMSFPGGLNSGSKIYLVGNGVEKSAGTWILEKV